jgi:type II secretory pathway component PulM
MYYVEFYSRKAGVDPEHFRETVKRTDAYWASANPKDRPVLAIGRTWRLGGPHYIVVWEIPAASRIDEWTAQRLEDPEARRHIEEWLEVVDCDAGLYEDLGLEQL